MDMYDLRNKYGIQSIEVENRYRTAESLQLINMSDHYQIETMLTVKINETNLKKMLASVDKFEELNKKHYEDMYVRVSNPTVTAAYEKYQMFLELARSETRNDRLN